MKVPQSHLNIIFDFTKVATSDEFFFGITELDTRKFDRYDSLYTSTSVSPYSPHYIYANAHNLISSSFLISAFVLAAYTTASFFQYCIDGLFGHNLPVDVNKISSFFLFNTDNVVMKNIKATTHFGGFNKLSL